jgi:hypothetical protein
MLCGSKEVKNFQKVSKIIKNDQNLPISHKSTSINPKKFQKIANGGVWVDRVEWNPDSENSASLQQALDAGWTVTTAGDDDWFSTPTGDYYGDDCAESGDISDEESSEMSAIVEGSGTVSFYWKVSSEQDADYLKFYLDGEIKGVRYFFSLTVSDILA